MHVHVARFINDFCRGSQTAAAELLEVTQPTVSEWLREVRPVPHASAADMERLSGGAVLATDTRADSRWGRVKDKTWPWHKDGRPVLEVSRCEQ